MNDTNLTIAEAFAHHQFSMTFDHLADDIRWHNVRGEDHRGKQAVIDACNRTAEYLSSVQTNFTRFRIITSSDCVVIDSQAEYLDGDETSTVASCDIFDFADAALTAITSYAVEL